MIFTTHVPTVRPTDANILFTGCFTENSKDFKWASSYLSNIILCLLPCAQKGTHTNLFQLIEYIEEI